VAKKTRHSKVHLFPAERYASVTVSIVPARGPVKGDRLMRRPLRGEAWFLMSRVPDASSAVKRAVPRFRSRQDADRDANCHQTRGRLICAKVAVRLVVPSPAAPRYCPSKRLPSPTTLPAMCVMPCLGVMLPPTQRRCGRPAIVKPPRERWIADTLMKRFPESTRPHCAVGINRVVKRTPDPGG